MANLTARRLTLGDISDLRDYEHEREDLRARVIDLKRRRRVTVGPFVTLVFENIDTMRFQVQEMVRAERMISDEQVQEEIDTYNPLIPQPGELSATLFVELTSDGGLRQWLPKLVGIERSVVLRLGGGPPVAGTPATTTPTDAVGQSGGSQASPEVVRFVPDARHAASLTREEVTAAVHYVKCWLTPEEVEAFAEGPASLAIEHPAYSETVELEEPTRRELLFDLRG